MKLPHTSPLLAHTLLRNRILAARLAAMDLVSPLINSLVPLKLSVQLQ